MKSIFFVVVAALFSACDISFAKYDGSRGPYSRRPAISIDSVSDVTTNSAILWTRVGFDSAIIVRQVRVLSTSASAQDYRTSIELQDTVQLNRSNQYHSIHFPLDALEPGTQYVIVAELRYDNGQWIETSSSQEFSFSTKN